MRKKGIHHLLAKMEHRKGKGHRKHGHRRGHRRGHGRRKK